MLDMSEKYCKDMIPYANLTLFELYELVRKLPYKLEDGEFQVLARPLHSLNGSAPYLACANKSIIFGGYCNLRNIPFCFVSVGYGNEENYSHVFPEIKVAGKYLPFDATYANYRLTLGPEPYQYAKRLYNAE